MATVQPAHDRVASLALVSARAGAMLGAYAALLVLVPVLFVAISFGGVPLAALPAAMGRPLLVVLLVGAVFGAFWFVVYGALWLLDRHTTLLEPDGARARFAPDERVLREGRGAFQASAATPLGKLVLTTKRLRFRSFRIFGCPVDESIALAHIQSARVVYERVGALRAGRLLVTLVGGETRAFYGFNEAEWRDAVSDAVRDRGGVS